MNAGLPLANCLSEDTRPYFVRRSIGVELTVSKKYDCLADSARQAAAPVLYEDGFFLIRPHTLVELKTLLIERQRSIVGAIASGKTISVLLPERDPPILRVTKTSYRDNFFNFGETQRPNFLLNLPQYPFKRHQEAGVKWLTSNRSCILADDMGLGKTLQAIAAFEKLRQSRAALNALVLCPKSLIGNWEAEIALWAPHLCTIGVHTRIDDKTWKRVAQQSHVAITNYENLRRASLDSDAFDLVIFDEIHRLKNSESAVHKAALQLRPKYSWGLTGTPLENSAKELISILQLIDRKRISDSDRDLPIASIRSLASKYVLRRQKSVISDELQSVTEKVEKVLLTPAQRDSYSRVLNENKGNTEHEWLATFNRLRDICDFDPDTKQSGKIDRAITIIRAISELKQKVVVFSYRLEPLKLVRQRLTDEFGATSVSTITGNTDSQKRTDLVRHFQSSGHPFVLLCSMRATAEGLTLTNANHVIFLNEWWNPALNRQARDRVNRIGQTQDVFVYRLRAVGTIETRLEEILEEKRELFDEIIERLAIATRNPKSEYVHNSLKSLLDIESGRMSKK